ncbi:unnamed protein product [Tetraodon nigroviridis]|uniref:(spotted green pufferfish) hypothetical protein n=1 Tax=Tetraodon nigroviridis TaxID=99883 RepID=Q4T1P7_TETNG|nr:unnamed protein product [Tetraodon nigroviridis]
MAALAELGGDGPDGDAAPQPPCPDPTVSVSPSHGRRRKLVLHVDLNNTILISDAVTAQGTVAALENFLSSVTWGRMSREGPGTSWLSQSSREQLSRASVLLLQGDGELAVRGEDGRLYHWILPSFFQLLRDLAQERREFAVVFRTFGSDLPRVLRALSRALKEGAHPLFPDLSDLGFLKVNAAVGRIRCSRGGVVLTRDGERVSTRDGERGLYRYLSALQGLGGFQDHFEWWASNTFSIRGGKPLWVDPFDQSVQHIFIDDNIRQDDEDTIVHPKVASSRVDEDTPPSGCLGNFSLRLSPSFLSGKHLICLFSFGPSSSLCVFKVFLDPGGTETRTACTSELYDLTLVQTDLLQALSDRSYFTRRVHICLENYQRNVQPEDA